MRSFVVFCVYRCITVFMECLLIRVIIIISIIYIGFTVGIVSLEFYSIILTILRGKFCCFRFLEEEIGI